MRKGETDAFVTVAERRVQPLNMGINRQFFQYNTLTGDTTQNGDGVIGNPEFVGQISAPAQVGEWNRLVLIVPREKQNLTISVKLWYNNPDNTEERQA